MRSARPPFEIELGLGQLQRPAHGSHRAHLARQVQPALLEPIHLTERQLFREQRERQPGPVVHVAACDHRASFQTDPAKAKALLKSANAMGYEIKFLFRTDDPINVKVKDAIVKALTEAGFKATPVPTTTANYVAARDNTKRGHQRPLRGLVLRLAVGLDLAADRARFDRPGQDQLVRHELLGVQQQGRGLPDGRHPAAAAGPAGGRVERPGQADRPEVLPAVHDLLHRHRPGPRIARSRATTTTTPLGMPTWKNIWVSQ